MTKNKVFRAEQPFNGHGPIASIFDASKLMRYSGMEWSYFGIRNDATLQQILMTIDSLTEISPENKAVLTTVVSVLYQGFRAENG